jgi:hypothetical protein
MSRTACDSALYLFGGKGLSWFTYSHSCRIWIAGRGKKLMVGQPSWHRAEVRRASYITPDHSKYPPILNGRLCGIAFPAWRNPHMHLEVLVVSACRLCKMHKALVSGQWSPARHRVKGLIRLNDCQKLIMARWLGIWVSQGYNDDGTDAVAGAKGSQGLCAQLRYRTI